MKKKKQSLNDSVNCCNVDFIFFSLSVENHFLNLLTINEKKVHQQNDCKHINSMNSLNYISMIAIND